MIKNECRGQKEELDDEDIAKELKIDYYFSTSQFNSEFDLASALGVTVQLEPLEDMKQYPMTTGKMMKKVEDRRLQRKSQMKIEVNDDNS